MLFDGLPNKPADSRHSHDAYDAQKDFTAECHAECHALVLDEGNVEPVGDLDRASQRHVGFHPDLYQLIDDQNDEDNDPRQTAVGENFHFAIHYKMI